MFIEFPLTLSKGYKRNSESIERINSLLGTEFSKKEVVSALTRLSFNVFVIVFEFFFKS